MSKFITLFRGIPSRILMGNRSNFNGQMLRFYASHSNHSPNHRQMTADDLPLPSGDWYDANAKRQMRNNTALISGIAALIITISIVAHDGRFVLNWGPPKLEESDVEDM